MCQTLFQLIYMYSLSCRLSRSVASDPLRPHGLQPSRLLCPWGSPGKDTGVGCHALLQGIELALLPSYVFFLLIFLCQKNVAVIYWIYKQCPNVIKHFFKKMVGRFL